MVILCLAGVGGVGLKFQYKSVVEMPGYLSLIPALCGCRQGLSHLSFSIFETSMIIFACLHPNVVVRLK